MGNWEAGFFTGVSRMKVAIRARGTSSELNEERRKARLETADDIFRILLASDKDQQVISWLSRYIDDLAYRQTPEGKEGQ